VIELFNFVLITNPKFVIRNQRELKINWNIKHYSKLTINEFHDLIQLRISAFVVEQNCPYQELDGKDKNSFHLIALNEHNHLVATARILPKGISYSNDVAIGRVVISPNYRMNKIGHQLMQECLNFIDSQFGAVSVRISAQKHLENYYAQHHFVSTGKEYLEDNIPHVEMLKY